MAQKLIDETGNKYGFLTVLSITKDKNHRTAWLCRCDCGNTKIVRGTDLRTGKITTCGSKCPLKGQRSGIGIDETNHRYGRLTVLYEDQNRKNGKRKWVCQCDCGNIKSIAGTDLRSGKVVSCGCYNKQICSNLQFKDERGNRYGKLTVESLVTKHPKAIWHCKCDCGRYIDVRGVDLRSGNTKSCGCLSSWYEERIALYLTGAGIDFERQYVFKDLIGEERPLRFDFALFKDGQLKGLIEYNGIQHYEPIEFWGGLEYLEKQQRYDNMKVLYTQQRNIPLLILNKTNINLEEDIQQFWEENYEN